MPSPTRRGAVIAESRPTPRATLHDHRHPSRPSRNLIARARRAVLSRSIRRTVVDLDAPQPLDPARARLVGLAVGVAAGESVLPARSRTRARVESQGDLGLG
jgi:hypothetical protein